MSDWLSTKDFSYELPEDRIALHPLAKRDDARLLVYKGGRIQHGRFVELADYLEVNSTLFFNDTRVIPARLIFRKETGAAIEILLVSPLEPPITQSSMTATGSCTWHCMVGNQKRWTPGPLLERRTAGVTVTARLIDKTGKVEFSWSPSSLTFAEVLQSLGDTPLPPYIKRLATPSDIDRYQTVYAHHEGAVAAPTAGLHFTDDVRTSIRNKGINEEFITLHVSAGTFLPIKHENALQHPMHEEHVLITKQNLHSLMSGRKVVAVGTTTLRTLESLYWYGCKLAEDAAREFDIKQEDPYRIASRLPLARSLENVLVRMGRDNVLHGRTSIYIRPGYTFQVCDALVTNFHQPGSTLLLLIAAFAGPGWKDIYEEALRTGYRFLSYGDSSLLFRV